MRTIKPFRYLSTAILGLFYCLPVVALGDVSGLDTFYGVYGGSSLSGGSVDVEGTSVESTRRSGMNLGSYAEFPLLSWLYVRTEFSLVQKGYADTDGNLLRLDYLELPLLLNPKFYFRWGSLYFPLGISYGIMLKRDTVDTEGHVTRIESSALAMNELCLHAGMGAEINLGRNWGMFATLRYSSGLTNVFQSSLLGANTSFHSSAIYTLIGFFFANRDEIDMNETRAREYLERQSGQSSTP